MSDHPEHGLWSEIRQLRADLATLRNDLHVRLIEQQLLVQEMKSVAVDIDRLEVALEKAVAQLSKAIAEASEKLEDEIKTRVSLDRFSPVERISYGQVALIAGLVFGALALLLFK